VLGICCTFVGPAVNKIVNISLPSLVRLFRNKNITATVIEGQFQAPSMIALVDRVCGGFFVDFNFGFTKIHGRALQLLLAWLRVGWICVDQQSKLFLDELFLVKVIAKTKKL